MWNAGRAHSTKPCTSDSPVRTAVAILRIAIVAVVYEIKGEEENERRGW